MNIDKKPASMDVIKRMLDTDNQGCRLAPLSNITAADIKGKNGYITIGVPPEEVLKYMNKEIGYGGLFLIDKKAFEAVEKELIEAVPA